MAGRWGLMVHWIAPGPPPERPPHRADPADAVNCFDVPRFLEDFAATGAQWLIFTVGQNSGYYASPNSLLNNWAGPGHCSDRDLVREIMDGVTAMPAFDTTGTPITSPRKRFIAYLPCEVAGNPAVQDAFRWTREEGTAQTAFQDRYTRFVEEYARRWGTKCSGWWFDGCYTWSAFPNKYMDWTAWRGACNAGNPDSVLAYNDGSFCVGNTGPVAPDQDYLAGEAEILREGKIRLGRAPNPEFHAPQVSTDAAGCRWHALVPIDCVWAHGVPADGVFAERFAPVPDTPVFPMESPAYSDDELLAFLRPCLSVGGAVTLNVGIYQEGHLGAKTVAQLSRLRPAFEAIMRQYTETHPNGVKETEE